MKTISLFALAFFGLISNSSAAEPRWFDPKYDTMDTLRACFKVTQMVQTGSNSYEFRLEYSGDDTGVDKLDRKNHYSTIRDVEMAVRGSLLEDSDPVVYAFRKGIYACEISWDYGMHWVVSHEDVSGDR
ncbi:hypothetical protein EBZ37_14820 [bacterium]|nr:hypothetical protein [bacterium]